MLDMICSGRLRPQLLVEQTVALEDSIGILTGMDNNNSAGISVIIPGS